MFEERRPTTLSCSSSLSSHSWTGDSVSIFATQETATTTSRVQAFGPQCRRRSSSLKRPHAVFFTVRQSTGKRTENRQRRSECNRLWLLKNSLSVSNSQKLGDGKCLPAWRKSLISHPDANQFLRFLGIRVFQQPRLFASTDERSRAMFSALIGDSEQVAQGIVQLRGA